MARDGISRVRAASGVSRIIGNAAWLLGGKGFGAVCSLVYLAILSRSLGLRDFGHFSLIFATGQAFVALASFQTWQAIVRYGARRVHGAEWDRFGRLVLLCGLLDWIGAALGCMAAWFVYYRLAGVLGLNPAYVDMAFVFNCVLLWSRVSAPVGVVRVLDRFDIATYVEAIVPTGRLLAAFALWVTGPSVGRFLFAWAAIDLISAACYWIAASRLAPQALKARHLRDWRLAIAENEGIRRFFGITYASSTLDAAYKQGPVLAVGYFLGTSAAGLYRLADQLAQGFGKLSQLLARAIYSEINKAHVAVSAVQFRQLISKLTGVAALAGALVVALALVAGRQLLGLIGGASFTDGAVVFVPLVLAASFELASVTYEPVLHATNHARLVLFARLLAVVSLTAGTIALVGFGSVGIAWAVAAGQAVGYLTMGAMVLAVLRPVPA